MNKTIKFTEKEWSVLMDRLGLPCCISEALGDGCEDKKIVDRVHELQDYKPGSLLLIKDDLTWDILQDAVDGSVVLVNIEEAVACDEITRSQASSIYAAAASVERKLGASFMRD